MIEIEGLEEELAEELADASPLAEEIEEAVEDDAGPAEEFEELEMEVEIDEPAIDGDYAAPELRVVDEESEMIVEEEERPPFEIEEVKEEPEVEIETMEEPEPEVIEEEIELSIAAQVPEKRVPGGQAELSLEGGPRGRFEGETPNVVKGEDLDVPPYLRRKGRRR